MKCLIFLLSSVIIVQSLGLLPNYGGFQIVSKFIGDLVRDAVASEKHDFFYILLLWMERQSEKDFYGEIAWEASSAALMKFDCFLPLKVKIQLRFSMIIVVTDENDGVIRNFLYLFIFSKFFLNVKNLSLS